MASDADLFQSEPPLAGSEIEALVGSLNRMRTYLLWKCGGLDAAGIRATLPPSTVTLGGLLKHLSAVEATTFAWKLHGRRPFPPFDDADWEGDPDFHWRSEEGDNPEAIEGLYPPSVAPGPAPPHPGPAPRGAGGAGPLGRRAATPSDTRRRCPAHF